MGKYVIINTHTYARKLAVTNIGKIGLLWTLYLTSAAMLYCAHIYIHNEQFPYITVYVIRAHLHVEVQGARRALSTVDHPLRPAPVFPWVRDATPWQCDQPQCRAPPPMGDTQQEILHFSVYKVTIFKYIPC